MKVSLNWIKEYVDIDCPASEVAEILSDLGFPTEEMEEFPNDTVIDVEVTSNRGDCLSHIGVARELAAFWSKQLRIPEVAGPTGSLDSCDKIKVEIENPDLCNRYTGIYIEGVKVGPSPDWLVERLESVGLRSVNNVVDATNYAMFETGQPAHAFDYDKVADGTIIVRNAQKGETITSIDHTECKLTPDMLVIADPKGPVAIAGVMGGLETEVSDATVNILLENAHFDPVTVRTASRGLNLPSDASFRFERHVDTERVEYAAHRCAQLIVHFAGGTIAKGIVDNYPKKADCPEITLRPARLSKLLGIDIPQDKTLSILTNLGLAPKQQGDTIVCTSPTWRHDLHREVDLIEEVARCHGYTNIPTEKKINIEVAPVDKREKLTNLAARVLNAAGYYETINVTFTDDKTHKLFAPETDDPLRVGDESRKSANIIRQNLLGSLLHVTRTNLNVGNAPVNIYEIANTFAPAKGQDLPDEKPCLAIVTTQGIRHLRGVITNLVRQVNPQAVLKFETKDGPWSSAGLAVSIDSDTLGFAGIIDPKITSALDIESEVAAAELDFNILMSHFGVLAQVKPIPRFPSVVRDLSLILDEAILWDQVTAAIESKAPAQLEKISFVDIYRGKPIPKGKKSLTLSLRFRDEDGTLTHETVDTYEKPIVDALAGQFGAELRTA